MLHLVEHFDHFVVPVDDIVKAEEFYINILGAQQAFNARGPMRYGLNVHQTIHGMRPHTFFVAAGKRIGVYLQSEHRPDAPYKRGAPTYSFETTAAGLAALEARLKAAGMICDGPIDGASPFALSSLYFCDPSGNNLAVYVPVKPNATAAHPRAPGDQLTAIGYLQLEAPDLEASVRFYCDTFSLPTPEYGVNPQSGAPEARILMPSGQALVLTKVPFGPKGMKLSRFEAGPHLAFFLPATRWDTMMAQLEKCGIQHGDRAAIAKGRTSVELDTYFEDPAGYVIQLISALET